MDVRVVAATNVDVQSQISVGAFRQDLYFRLAQFCVESPPLRDRREDIPMLATHFVHLFPRKWELPEPGISSEALAALSLHDFPGNVRELKNVIERGLIESEGQTITPRHLHITSSRPKRPTVAAIAQGGDGTGRCGRFVGPPAQPRRSRNASDPPRPRRDGRQHCRGGASWASTERASTASWASFVRSDSVASVRSCTPETISS